MFVQIFYKLKLFVFSNENTLATAEVGDYPDHSQSPNHVPENLSADSDVSNSAVPEYNESKQETTLLSGGQQYSVVHTNPNSSFGFAPPVLGSQFAPFENSESQARDVSRLPSFVVSIQNFLFSDFCVDCTSMICEIYIPAMYYLLDNDFTC